MAAAEQKKSYAVIQNFKGLNTKANRVAIDREEFSWIENAMPIGFGNIKIVPAQTPVLTAANATVTFANTVTFLSSANINVSDYVIVSEDNGRAEYYNFSTKTVGNVAVAGTFSNSGISIAQWKNERVIIGDPSKGLYSWNANNLVSIGSVGLIAVSNGGAGYIEAPDVILSAPNDANGVQATAEATISASAGSITAITITNDGSGYTVTPTVIIGPPNQPTGTQARATATTASGKLTSITVIDPGSGYTAAPTISFAAPAGSGAAATANVATGIVSSVVITEAGSGYTSPPTVTFVDGGGNNAAAIAELLTFKKGTVHVLVTNGGSGYTNTANIVVSFSGGGGTGLAANAVVFGGQITNIVTSNPGSGYTSNPTVTITGGGGNSAKAIAIANLDDVVDVATFSGRVWVAAGRTVYYSAAGSYSDFTSVSAGSFTITDSTLHGNIKALLSANNFLYVFGDDSINVFSDVRVSSTGQTLFTNTNVSASIGTRRIYAIFAYFRSVLFMNDYGIYALVGSTTSKISDPLDGIFPLIDFNKPVSAGQVLVNNILCAAFSFTYNDPVAGARPIQAVFFEKKWFLTSQGTISLVTSVPVEGSINLYGTIGKSLYRLYGNATANVASTIQTALQPMGDNIRTKQALKFGVEATLSQGTTINVTVDSEKSASPAYTLTTNYNVYWVNNSNQIVSWTNATGYWINNSSQVTSWVNNLNNTTIWSGPNYDTSLTLVDWLGSTSGYTLYKSDAQQYGKYIGLTMKSNNAAFTVHAFDFEHELRVRF